MIGRYWKITPTAWNIHISLRVGLLSLFNKQLDSIMTDNFDFFGTSTSLFVVKEIPGVLKLDKNGPLLGPGIKPAKIIEKEEEHIMPE